MSKPDRLPCGRIAPSPRSPQPRKSARGHWESKLRSYIDTHQLKNSESRNKILKVITEYGRHFTPQELVKIVSARFPEVGAATIYRNIPILLAAQILQESLTQESGEILYELSDDDHHDHIVCVECGTIFEFHEEVIEKVQDNVMRDLKFKALRHKHVIYAQCEFIR